MHLPLSRLARRVGLTVHRWPGPNTLQRHLQTLFTDLGVDLVLDVGANRGQFAESLREAGFRGHIVSFEPNAAVAGLARARAASDPRWHVETLALGDAPGTLDLHVSRDSVLSSVLEPSAYSRQHLGELADTVATQTVEVARLDARWPAIRASTGARRPFLKMDTQGYDLAVLRGAEGLHRDLAGLMTEVSFQPLYDGMPDVTESLAALRTAGFAVTGLFPVVHDGNGALIEMDCVARRRAS